MRREQSFEQTGCADGPAAADSLTYLYCVVDAASAAIELLQSRAIAGIDPTGPVYSIGYGAVAAVISQVPAAVFEEEPLNALLADLPALTPYAIRHQEVVGAVQAVAAAVVPFTFGAIYRDSAGVRDLLSTRQDQLIQLLEQVRGKREWGILGVLDRRRLIETTESTSDTLRQLADAAERATPGRAYLLRKQLERQRLAEAERLRNKTVDEILARLAKVSVDLRCDEVVAEPSAAQMVVLKAALLVERDAEAGLQAVVDELAEHAETLGLALTISGPWAPYSFVVWRADDH